MCLETWIKLVLHRELADDCGLCGRPSSRAQSRNAMPTATRYCELKKMPKAHNAVAQKISRRVSMSTKVWMIR